MLNNKKGIFFLVIFFTLIFGYLFLEDDFLEYQKFQEDKKFVEEFNSGEWQKKNKTEKKYQDKLIIYREKLPNFPETEDVKKYFIDENKNGVRDDVEIKIVRRFWEHKDMVESFFAEYRAYEYEVYLVKNNLLDNEYVIYASFLDRNISECSSYFYKKGSHYVNGDYVYVSSKIFKNYNNTVEKKKIENVIFRKIWGRGWALGKSQEFIDEETCRDFFEKSKNLTPR